MSVDKEKDLLQHQLKEVEKIQRDWEMTLETHKKEVEKLRSTIKDLKGALQSKMITIDELATERAELKERLHKAEERKELQELLGLYS